MRRLRPEEWTTLRAVRLAALLDAPAAFGNDHATSAGYPPRRWQEMTAARVVACAGDVVLGMAGWERCEAVADTWQLVAVWVAPPARGRGVLELLVADVDRRARAAGMAGLALYVYEANTRAVAAYQRLGFQTAARTGSAAAPSRLMIRR